ncbi:MAG: hypothetical protein M3Z26_12595 [Bacteroidota bacterium]|nr:hypothetical protein [Bacteroidota bacterium]
MMKIMREDDLQSFLIFYCHEIAAITIIGITGIMFIVDRFSNDNHLKLTTAKTLLPKAIL